MKKFLITILVLILGFMLKGQTTLRINKFLVDSFTNSAYRLWHDSTHAGNWGLVGGSGGGGGGSGTVTSVTGTANRITITGTPTVAPVVNIAATYVGQTSITTLGTIATGVWNGTAIANANLANSSLTIGSTNISLGATSTSLAGLTSVTSTTFNGALSGNATTATALATGRTISISGDLTYTSPSFDGSANVTAAGTLATVNSNVGTFGSATQAGTFTVNGKGLITAASNVTITPAESSVTFTDITTNNTSTSAHGYFPKLTSNSVYYVNNSGALTALALGANGTVLTSNGATSAPTFTAPAGGAGAWSALTDPTSDLALTFQAGESTTMTDQNTTEDHWTVTSSTGTTNSLYSLNRTGTALASGNNIMELVSSGANASSTITSTALRISNTNTGTSSTNVGINISTTGATTNYPLITNNLSILSTGAVEMIPAFEDWYEYGDEMYRDFSGYFDCVSGGAGSAVYFYVLADNLPDGWAGAVDLNVGTGNTSAANAGCYITASAAGALSPISLNGAYRQNIGYKLQFPNLSDGTDTYVFSCGFADAALAPASASNGAYFEYTHTLNSGNWTCTTESLGTKTQTDSGIPVAINTDYALEVSVFGGVAKFYINKVLVATNATNVPAASAQVGGYSYMYKAAGTTARSYILDWARFGTRNN